MHVTEATQAFRAISDALFDAAISTLQLAKPALGEVTAEAAIRLVACLAGGHKILACGNGGSAADAQHFVAELVNRFETERRPLPALALNTDSSIVTSIGNDYGFDQVFGKQVQALGCSGDVLLAFSTSGNSANILRAIEVAQHKEMGVVLLAGRDGGRAAQNLHEKDLALIVPAEATARIQEVHGLLIHVFCRIIDLEFSAGEADA